MREFFFSKIISKEFMAKNILRREKVQKKKNWQIVKPISPTLSKEANKINIYYQETYAILLIYHNYNTMKNILKCSIKSEKDNI